MKMHDLENLLYWTIVRQVLRPSDVNYVSQNYWSATAETV